MNCPDCDTPMEREDVALGTIWRRINGRERVQVQRVWFWPDEGWTVRAHPIRGGKVLVADMDWFKEHYTREDSPPDGGWPQISYRCPACHPVGLDVTEDADYGRAQTDVPTKGRT